MFSHVQHRARLVSGACMVRMISHSIRDVIDPHDERASEWISKVTATRPSNSAVGSTVGNALSTRSTADGPESSEVHLSVTTRNSRGNGGSRIFDALNSESHTTQNVCIFKLSTDISGRRSRLGVRAAIMALLQG